MIGLMELTAAGRTTDSPTGADAVLRFCFSKARVFISGNHPKMFTDRQSNPFLTTETTAVIHFLIAGIRVIVNGIRKGCFRWRPVGNPVDPPQMQVREKGVRSLLSHKDEFAGRWLKRWRNVRYFRGFVTSPAGRAPCMLCFGFDGGVNLISNPGVNPQAP